MANQGIEIFAGDCRGKVSSATASFNIATITLYVVLIVHTVGFALPYWIEISWIQYDLGNSSVVVESKEIVGLWKECLCGTSTDMSECNCKTKVAFTGMLRKTQILETVGIIGLILSGIISTIILCVRQGDKILKVLNILTALSSGTCIMVGVIVFEREAFDDVALDSSSSEKRSSLSASFILCTVAAGLCMFCVPLLVIDLCNHGRPERQELQLIHVENMSQEQFFTGPIQSRHPPTSTTMQDDMLP